MSRFRAPFMLLALAIAAAIAIPAVAQDDGPTGTVTVVHAIPEATVDVYANGDVLLEDFEPGTVTDPVALPVGTYDLEVYAANDDPTQADPVTQAMDVEVTDGLNASVVAHLNLDGNPNLGVYANDLSAVEDGQARVTVRHVADAPTVDVYADDAPLLTDLSNPDEDSRVVEAGTYAVAVAPAGTSPDDAVIGPLDVAVAAGQLTIVYAVFSLADGTLTAITQMVPLGDAEPTATADVSVVHAIPEATVDVYANGDVLLEDFEPGTVTDPVALPAGTYDLEVYAADADPAEDAPVVAAEGVEVPADINASVVAHLTEEGEPALAVFVNDLSSVDHAIGRVTVRHTAQAPAVDVFVNGDRTFTELANPDEVAAELPEGTYQVAVSAAGGSIDEAVIGPLDLPVPGDTLTVVYAAFSLPDGSLSAITQTLPLGLDGDDDDSGEPTRTTSRLAGASRIDTAIAISQRAFPEGSDVVYLARQDVLADSVAAGVLTDGPILLVPNCGDLPTQVADEIRRLDAQEAIGLGGELAVCDAILDQASRA